MTKMIICLKGGSEIEIDLSKCVVNFGMGKLVVNQLDGTLRDKYYDSVILPLELVEDFKICNG